MEEKEAKDRIKARFDKWALDNKDLEALQTLYPELIESEDERIRKDIIGGLMWQRDNLKSDGPHDNNLILPGFCLTVGEHLAYLKKQKENIEREYVFRPLAGTDITIAAEQAIRRVNEGDHLVLAFNGAYIPVRKGCNVNKIVDIYDAFIERQKEQKVDIDKLRRDLYQSGYNDGYQHGMEDAQKEQKPRKFKIGDKVHWHDDDTNVITITGFRDDAYLTDSAYGPILFCDEDNWERVEQKPAEEDEDTDFELRLMDCMSAAQQYSHEIEWDVVKSWAKELSELCPHPRPEWSKEDEKMRNKIIGHLSGFIYPNSLYGEDAKMCIDWLKSLRPHWKPSKWRHYIWAVNLRFDYDGLVRYEDNGSYEIVTAGNKPKRQVNGEYILLKDISSTNWKPSEEQMEAFKDIFGDFEGCPIMKSLYEELEKLM